MGRSEFSAQVAKKHPTEFHRLLDVMSNMEKTFCRSSQVQHDQAELNMRNYAQKTKDLAQSKIHEAITTGALAVAGTGTGIGAAVQSANNPNSGETLKAISEGLNKANNVAQSVFSSGSVQTEADRMFLQDAFQRQMQEHQSAIGLARDANQKRDAIAEAKFRENRGG